MTLKTNYLRVLIVLSGLALLLDSCRKNLPFCRQNCADLNINGRVYNKTNDDPFGNIPVEVSLFRRGSCFGCTSYKVAAGKTAADGYFNFELTIDSSLLKDFFLSVRIPSDSNYFIAPNPSAHFSEVRLYDSISNALQNLEFKFYPKTLLTIRLHRTLTDNFDFFTVENIFDSTTGSGYHDIIGTQVPTDTSFRVQTSTNIYTRIIWSKRLMGGVQLNQQMDSLIAADNGSSVFDINY